MNENIPPDDLLPSEPLPDPDVPSCPAPVVEDDPELRAAAKKRIGCDLGAADDSPASTRPGYNCRIA